MTGHVAQVIDDEELWAETLRASFRALRSGGTLAFESRNPAARAWEQWTRSASYAVVDPSPLGAVAVWDEVLAVAGSEVRFAGHTVLLDTGHHLVAHETLRFRTSDEILAQLHKAGFAEPVLYGDFDKTLLQVRSPEIIVIARRNA